MDKVSMSTYEADKNAFYKKHNSKDLSWPKESSELKDGVTHKTVIFEDDAAWYEVSRKVTQNHLATLTDMPDITVNLSVDLFETEYYSTDDPKSKYAYDLFDYRAVSM